MIIFIYGVEKFKVWEQTICRIGKSYKKVMSEESSWMNALVISVFRAIAKDPLPHAFVEILLVMSKYRHLRSIYNVFVFDSAYAGSFCRETLRTLNLYADHKCVCEQRKALWLTRSRGARKD